MPPPASRLPHSTLILMHLSSTSMCILAATPKNSYKGGRRCTPQLYAPKGCWRERRLPEHRKAGSGHIGKGQRRTQLSRALGQGRARWSSSLLQRSPQTRRVAAGRSCQTLNDVTWCASGGGRQGGSHNVRAYESACTSIPAEFVDTPVRDCRSSMFHLLPPPSFLPPLLLPPPLPFASSPRITSCALPPAGPSRRSNRAAQKA